MSGAEVSYPAPILTRRPMRTPRTVGISFTARSNAAMNAARSFVARSGRGFISTTCAITSSPFPPAAQPVIDEAGYFVCVRRSQRQPALGRHHPFQLRDPELEFLGDGGNRVDADRAKRTERSRHVRGRRD